MYAPNQVTAADAQNETTWHVLATDGTAYATLALLAAAGKTPFPGLSPGTFLQNIQFRTDNGAGAKGGNAFFHINQSVAPTDATAMLVDGALPQTLEAAGMVWNVWTRKLVGTDRVFVNGYY